MALITPDDLTGRAAAQGTSELARKRGLQVVIADTFPLGTTDFSTILTKVRAANPDVLGGLPTRREDVVAMIRQLKASDVNPRMVGLVGILVL